MRSHTNTDPISPPVGANTAVICSDVTRDFILPGTFVDIELIDYVIIECDTV